MSSNFILPEYPDSDDRKGRWARKSRFRVSKISKLTDSLTKGYLAKVVQQLETAEKEAAGEKWMKDFKELMLELSKDGDIIREQTDDQINQAEKLIRNYREDFDNIPTIRNKFLKASWASHYIKDQRKAIEKIKDTKRFLEKQILKDVSLNLANAKTADRQVKEAKNAVKLFFNEIVEELFVDAFAFSENSIQNKLSLPRIFLKLPNDNNIYVLIGHKKAGGDPYGSLRHHVYDFFKKALLLFAALFLYATWHIKYDSIPAYFLLSLILKTLMATNLQRKRENYPYTMII